MALDTSTEFYQNNTQAGLDKRLAQMQGMNAAPAPAQQQATAAPIPGADATGTLPGQAGYNPGATIDPTGTVSGQAGFNPGANRIDDVMSKLNSGAGTRTERAAYGAALDGMIKKNPALMSSSDLESAMQNAGTRTAKGAFGQAMAGQLIRGYAQGGKIKGPGTATSDSIPAKVAPTGEPIRVANGERIVSVEQDQALLRIAEMLGYDSVDAMLEALTGKPVGPTIKGGQRAAAGGANPDDWMRTHQTGDRTSIDYHPQPKAPAMDPADAELVKNASANFNKVFSDKDFVKPQTPEQAQATADHQALASGAKQALAAAADVVTLPGRAIADGIGAVGNAGARVLNAVVGKPVITDRYQSSLQNYGLTPFYDSVRPQAAAQPEAAPAPTAAPTPAPQQQTEQAPTGAGQPGEKILGTQPLDLTGRQQQYMENNNIREFKDAGNGVIRTLDGKGNRVITNVGTGDITDSTKRPVDGNESAAIDRQGSTYNPNKQYENMLRLRMLSDATDPTITDPRVQELAQQGLAILNAGQQGGAAANLHNAQAEQAQALTGQTKQMEAMRGKLLDPNTPPEERARMLQVIQAISGKGDATYDGHVVKGQIGEPDTFVTWDKRTGRPVFAGTGNELQQQQKAARPQQPTITPGMAVKAPNGIHTFNGKTVTVKDGKVVEVK